MKNLNKGSSIANASPIQKQDSQSNIIQVDEKEFKRVSKKLLTDFKVVQQDKSIDINLAYSQEMLAKSFGFRNYNSLHNFFNKKREKLQPVRATGYIALEKYSDRELTNLISMLLNPNGVSEIFVTRAIRLLSVVVSALVYMRDEKEVLLDFELINEYLILDNIIKLYKQRRDFPSRIRSGLRSYLMSLPGFQESAPKQSETTIEQHGYLQMQFYPVLEDLQQICKEDILIISPDWYQLNYEFEEINENSENTVLKNGVVKKFSKKINKETLDELFNDFSYSEVNHFFESGIPLKIKKNSNQMFRIENYKIIDKIHQHAVFRNSWLNDFSYNRIIKLLLINKEFQDFYFSDLLQYMACNIINPEVKNYFGAFIQNIVKDYSIATESSKKLYELS